ncbi:hypothetical protein GCM10009596_09350 [Arthrobacter rhombi]|uniref:SGNH/GDSL hydrolase family protein n=1 Tax=Arthrobacter rhombi TaxID=71253 RepID=UPI0031D275F4
MMTGGWHGGSCLVGAVTLLVAVLLVPSAVDPASTSGGSPSAAHGPAGSWAAAGAGGSRPAAVQQVVVDADTGRHELVVPHPASLAVLIGDSQADGAAGVPGNRTWPQMALHAAGYTVAFRGRAGTGYATGNGRDLDYVSALRQQRWLLPHGDVGLVVIEGGGNDARTGVADATIASAQAALIAELRRSYPRSPLVVIGTLARSSADGGGRRHQVDDLVGRSAREPGVASIRVGDWLTTHDLAAHLADQVHLDAEGHRMAAGVLLQALEDAGFVRRAGTGSP